MSQDPVNPAITKTIDKLKAGEYEAAIEDARSILESDQRNSEAWSLLAISYAKTGRTDEATEAFQKAIQTGPYVARNYYNLAMHYLALGQRVDAVSMCQEAIRCDPKHKGANEMLKKLESEMHVEVAPYTTSLGDNRGSAYHYKKEEKKEDSLDDLQQ